MSKNGPDVIRTHDLPVIEPGAPPGYATGPKVCLEFTLITTPPELLNVVNPLSEQHNSDRDMCEKTTILVRNGIMERRYLLGNEAIAHACTEAGVDFVSGYPGTPSSEVIDTLRVQPERSYYLEWSVNEKVALENALAAAWCGIRALCTMKHVGLNVAADPLMTSAYTGVTGGLVIMSADDPFAHSSQNEQDTRCYAHFARVPCLDPATVQEAHDMIPVAFSISEEFGLPVIFRPTTRICHSKGDVELGDPVRSTRKGEFHKDPRQYVVIPAHTRILHKKLNEKQPAIKKRLVEMGLNRFEIHGKTAIIASGIGASYVAGIVARRCLVHEDRRLPDR